MTPRWQVHIIVPDTGVAKIWDSYPDRERAESVAATLRFHKFFAMVLRVDPEPEPDRPRAA